MLVSILDPPSSILNRLCRSTSMTKLLRAAVIGAGSMGRNHARVYTEMDDVELVAIADPDQEALSKIAQRQHIRTYTSYQAMLAREQIDLVSVVVPTENH